MYGERDARVRRIWNAPEVLHHDVPQQRRRLSPLAVAGVAVAVAAALLLGGLALRPPPRPAVAEEPDAGVIAAAGDRSWTWSGPELCRPGPPTAIQPRVGDELGGPQPLPLRILTGLATSDGQRLVATGADADCNPAGAASPDGGATWESLPRLVGTSLSVGPAGTAWAVVPEENPQALLRRAPDGAVTRVEDRCPENKALTVVAAGSPVDVWAMCETPDGNERTLSRTRNGGRQWEWQVNDRSRSGLEGSGRMIAMSFSGQRGWLLMESGRCPEGELRETTNGGDSWQRLPCVTQSTAVTRLLGMTFTSETAGRAVGVRGPTTIELATSDAGRTWRTLE